MYSEDLFNGQYEAPAPFIHHPHNETIVMGPGLSPFGAPQTFAPTMTQRSGYSAAMPPPAPMAPMGNQRDEARSVAASDWTLALSEITYRPGEAVPMNIMEELLLLKAGDKAKFAKHNPTLDRILAAALIMELVLQRKVTIDAEFSHDPKKVQLRIIDDSETESKLVNSAIKALKKHGNNPLTVSHVLQRVAKTGKGLTQKMLWRLVQKQKVTYDPRMFGVDKYPVVDGAADLQQLRERVVSVMDRVADIPNVRDELLAFLYYLPKNAADRIFAGQSGTEVNQLYTICRAVAWAMQDFKQNQSWI